MRCERRSMFRMLLMPCIGGDTMIYWSRNVPASRELNSLGIGKKGYAFANEALTSIR